MHEHSGAVALPAPPSPLAHARLFLPAAMQPLNRQLPVCPCSFRKTRAVSRIGAEKAEGAVTGGKLER